MKEFFIEKRLMGSAFKLGVVANSEQQANELLSFGIAEISRLELLLSEFIETSDTSKLNQAGKNRPTTVSNETLQLIKRALTISELTNGDFDITVAPLKKLYQFKNENFEMPQAETIATTLKQIGYNKLQINEQKGTITFSQANMRISFAAIGKGYAADFVKKKWIEMGVTSGYINASGDLNAFGTNVNNAPWSIGIAHPDQPNKMLLYIPLQNAAIATSGDYEQHFLYKGQRYSHNINPKTGKPLQGLKSVSIISPSAELSDALATAIYVKGWKDGLTFVNQLPHTHCVIIDEKNNIHISQHLQYESLPG